MAKYDLWTYLEITGRPEVKENCVNVVVKATGKPADLPFSEIQRWGGKIFVKKWLYDKICPAT